MSPADSHDDAAPVTISKTRLEAFSDGVFAIAITLLVLELTIRPHGDALHRVFDAWPSYFAYVVSFLTIGAAWLGHTWMTDNLERADSLLLRLNLLLLLVVAFLPFPTRLVAESLRNTRDERVFVTFYGITLLVIRLMLALIDRYSTRQRLYTRTGRTDDDLRADRRKLLPVTGGYVIAIGVGLAAPTVGVIIYFALAVFLIVPFRGLWRLFVQPD
jgi:uncharacterized membrane protein